MAREHARIWLDINSDDEFEQLPFDAQGFYTRVVLTLDDLSYCGVADWRPRKLTTKAPDLPLARILTAAHHLEAGRYCLFDLTTEEILARSFIRRDELLRNPKMAAAVIKAYSGIASKQLRAAVVDEIRRVRDEHPEYSSWSHKDTGPALSKIMGKDGSAEVPYTDQIPVPITNGQTVPITNRIGNPDPVQISNTQTVQNSESIGYADSVPIPSTYTSTSTPAPLEGLRNRGTSPDDPDQDPNDPPPRFCPDHPAGTDRPCTACGAARERRKAWDAEQPNPEALAAKALADFWTEVRACRDCDQNGNVDAPDPDTDEDRMRRCERHDWTNHRPRQETAHA